MVNHLSDDPFLYLKEMVIDSQVDETYTQERANVEKVMMFVEDGENDEIPVVKSSEAAMLIKVTQSQLYKLAFGKYDEEKGIETTSINDVKKLIGFHSNVVMKLANAIAKHLEFDSNWINDESKSARILTFYIPVALWLYQQVQIGKKVDPLTGEYASSLENAVCVGLSIPQGGGKTTISGCLEVALLELGIQAGVVSYDDFYLTYEDQKKVAEKYSDNRFL